MVEEEEQQKLTRRRGGGRNYDVPCLRSALILFLREGRSSESALSLARSVEGERRSSRHLCPAGEERNQERESVRASERARDEGEEGTS